MTLKLKVIYLVGYSSDRWAYYSEFLSSHKSILTIGYFCIGCFYV